MNANESETPAAKTARAKQAMKETLRLVKKLGAGAIELLRKLKKDKSPQAMLKTLEDSQAANQSRRESVQGRLEKQYSDIATRKKAYASASKARQQILEAELSALLPAYNATKRELMILLENEKVLAQTKGRMQEALAYGLAGVGEEQIDDVIDEVEEKVAAAEGRLDAARDLERAGKRRERESEKESLWDQLEEFEEGAPSKLSQEMAEFEEPEEPRKKKEAEKEKET